MEHKFEKHTNCEKARCIICDGDLAFCTVCNGAEGSLPTECPGIKMTSEQQDRVYHAEIDFRQGKWNELPVSLHQPA